VWRREIAPELPECRAGRRLSRGPDQSTDAPFQDRIWRKFFLAYATKRLHISPVDAVFKALADESRRKLLDRLHSSNGQTLTELCRNLDMSRQAVTKHLGLLEAANLITVVWHGREKLHYLNPVPLHEIYERWISKYERHRLQALSDLKKGLEQHKKEQ
jgi:DNA-binding transcriptional ArsR family regulator